jgi:adenylate cyclase
MLELVFHSPSGRAPFPLTGAPVRIGRDVDCDLFLEDPSVSRQHAEIRRDGGDWVLRDLGSTNGVLLNGEVVREAPLRAGDQLRLGVFELAVRETGPAPGEVPWQATVVRRLAPEEAPWGATLARRLEPAEEGRGEKRRRLEQAYGNQVFGCLLALAGDLLKATSVEQVLERVLDVAFEVLPASRGFALLQDDDGQLVCELAWLGDERLRRPAGDLPLSWTLLRTVVGERMALITSDALTDQRLAAGESILRHSIRSALCVPLWSDEGVVGALQIDARSFAGAFTERDLDLLTAVANFAAVAIERIRYARKVEAARAARERLARYHSPAVIDEILAAGPGTAPGARPLRLVEISVLFADVVGFTAFSEEASPEEVMALLSPFFNCAVETIFAAGGTLDKFIGDCVMAFFGAPVETADHALAAVQAAVAIQHGVRQLNAERGARGLAGLAVRVAVNSGLALVGEVGSERRVDYTVLGDTVNVAARLESQAARPGEVVIGPDTERRVRGAVPLEPLGELPLKGLERRVAAFRVVLDGG